MKEMRGVKPSLLLNMWSTDQQYQPHLEAPFQASWVRICIFHVFPRNACAHDSVRRTAVGDSVIWAICDHGYGLDMGYMFWNGVCEGSFELFLRQTKNRRDLATSRPIELGVLAPTCSLDWVSTIKRLPEKWRGKRWQSCHLGKQLRVVSSDLFPLSVKWVN